MLGCYAGMTEMSRGCMHVDATTLARVHVRGHLPEKILKMNINQVSAKCVLCAGCFSSKFSRVSQSLRHPSRHFNFLFRCIQGSSTRKYSDTTLQLFCLGNQIWRGGGPNFDLGTLRRIGGYIPCKILYKRNQNTHKPQYYE